MPLRVVEEQKMEWVLWAVSILVLEARGGGVWNRSWWIQDWWCLWLGVHGGFLHEIRQCLYRGRHSLWIPMGDLGEKRQFMVVTSFLMEKNGCKTIPYFSVIKYLLQGGMSRKGS